MRLIAELSMPNVGSWNGKWTGSEYKYTIVVPKTMLKRGQDKEVIGNYSYNFGDGWRASIEIRPAKTREKVSNKFCGYEWMVYSILEKGEIIS